jgi:hypothetical protein
MIESRGRPQEEKRCLCAVPIMSMWYRTCFSSSYKAPSPKRTGVFPSPNPGMHLASRTCLETCPLCIADPMSPTAIEIAGIRRPDGVPPS